MSRYLATNSIISARSEASKILHLCYRYRVPNLVDNLELKFIIGYQIYVLFLIYMMN